MIAAVSRSPSRGMAATRWPGPTALGARSTSPYRPGMSTQDPVVGTAPATSPYPDLPDALGTLHFDEVVVPLIRGNLDDRGLHTASTVAKKLDLPVRIVNVHLGVGPGGDEDTARAMLESACDSFAHRHPELTVTSQLVKGLDVARGLAKTLLPTSLLVIATDRAGADDGAFSVAEALARERAGALLMVGPNARASDAPGPIVVAQDGSAAALESVVAAVALHRAWAGPLWLVHVVDDAAAEKATQLRAVGYAIQESAFVRDIADELTDAGYRAGWAIVGENDPAAAVVRFAEQHGAALIAATTRGIGDPGGKVFGSTCMRIVREALVPVAVMSAGGAHS